jgi:IPT/TIG domain/FG-GAP repeat
MTLGGAAADSSGRRVASRSVASCACAALLLAAACTALLAGATAGRSPSARGAPSANAEGVRELPSAARGPISATLGAAIAAYRIHEVGREARSVSPPQGLDARFARSGVTLDSGHAAARLRLIAAGYGQALDRVRPAVATATGNRIRYVRRGLDEWYVNGPLGLEQGFTVRHPAAHPSNALLSLSLALTGDVEPSVTERGRSILLSHDGRAILRYGELLARDANGRTLPSRLELNARTISIRVDVSGARFPVKIDPLIEATMLPAASDESGEGRFGLAVALSQDGTTALVGAPGDAGSTGAAWVFTRTGSSWTQQGSKLTAGEATSPAETEQCASDAGECGFGQSVALSDDGDTALIGSPSADGGSGAAWAFARDGSTWSQIGQPLTGDGTSGGRFGHSVALSGDGATALVGAPSDHAARGAAWSFTRSATGFARPGLELTPATELGSGHFGRSLALSFDGDTALVGAPGDAENAGAAWAFARSGESWTEQAKLSGGGEESAGGRFGSSAALSAGGDTALLGAISDGGGAGAAWVFTRAGSSWAQQGPKLTAAGELGEGKLGYSASLSADGDTALIGAPRNDASLGAAWTFTRSGASWSQQQQLTGPSEPAEGAYGVSVSLAADAGAALIGAPRAGRRLGGVWSYLGTPANTPQVTSVSPGEGSSAGGTPITIDGSGFLAGSTVTIGAVATSVDVVSETEITAVTAAAPPGAAEVVVSGITGASHGGPSYTYLEASAASADTGTQQSSATSGAAPVARQLARAGVLSSIASSLPPPILGLTGNVARLSGIVRVKLPGSSRFTLLQGGEQIPFGSIIDATHGRVSVTTAALHGGTQTMVFYEGEFKLTQQRNGLVVSTLFGGDLSSCPTGDAHRRAKRASAASAKRPVRKLWAEGHGSYSTKGNYATGAVLGTRWLTEDLCTGTLIRVATDRVAVTNLVNHRRLTVTAGHSYFARAPRGHRR